MAKNGTRNIGHNAAELSEDEKAALQLHFSVKIRAALAEEQKAAALKKAAAKAVASQFTLARAELHINRKDFEEILAKEDLTDEEFVAQESARMERFARQGLAVNPGTQFDMFPKRDTADEKALAYSAGLRAGRLGKDPVIPDSLSPICHPDWMDGWHAGQLENLSKIKLAEDVLERRKLAGGGLQAETADDEEGEGGEDDADPIWTQPTAEEATFANA